MEAAAKKPHLPRGAGTYIHGAPMSEPKRSDLRLVLSQPGGVRKPAIGKAKAKPLQASWKKSLFTWQRREQRAALPVR
jgi:hypothetical protein